MVPRAGAAAVSNYKVPDFCHKEPSCWYVQRKTPNQYMSRPSMRPSSDPMEPGVDRLVNWEHNGCSVPAISQCNGTVNQQTSSPLSHIASLPWYFYN